MGALQKTGEPQWGSCGRLSLRIQLHRWPLEQWVRPVYLLELTRQPITLSVVTHKILLFLELCEWWCSLLGILDKVAWHDFLLLKQSRDGKWRIQDNLSKSTAEHDKLAGSKLLVDSSRCFSSCHHQSARQNLPGISFIPCASFQIQKWSEQEFQQGKYVPHALLLLSGSLCDKLCFKNDGRW
jgi:hypothetical protein